MVEVGIIDYGMGNIWSVQSALAYVGTSSSVITKPAQVEKFSHLIIPGVGSFRKAMENIHELNLLDPIRQAAKQKECKILGICLGMQLLGSDSDEDGFTKGLGLINASVRKFKKKIKIPHIGFNVINIVKSKGLFANLVDPSDFYFVHSYRMKTIVENANICSCEYGEKFIAAFEYENICGTQFHPEKSQTNGLQLIRNFLS
jgi:imidazole glycerol-phosphate synthase subunit HisH